VSQGRRPHRLDRHTRPAQLSRGNVCGNGDGGHTRTGEWPWIIHDHNTFLCEGELIHRQMLRHWLQIRLLTKNFFLGKSELRV
jgi:hypothetical protein